MKEICLLIFSFLGICAANAQVTGNDVPGSNLKTASQKTSTDSGAKTKAAVKLYPNPVKNKAELEIQGFEPGPVQVQVLNSNGTVERNDQRLLATGNEHMVLMFSLPAGVYFVVLRQKDKLVKKKMLVQ